MQTARLASQTALCQPLRVSRVQRPFTVQRTALRVAAQAQVRPAEGKHPLRSRAMRQYTTLSGCFCRRVAMPESHCRPCGFPLVQRNDQPSLSQTFGSLAAVLGLLSGPVNPALAVDFAPPPTANTAVAEVQQSRAFGGDAQLTAPAVSDGAAAASGLPEGTQWRYSEFINAVQNGKVQRVRFSKDGAQLQLTAVDGRRALVVLPNDPELVDILAKNGVDISGMWVLAFWLGFGCCWGAGCRQSWRRRCGWPAVCSGASAAGCRAAVEHSGGARRLPPCGACQAPALARPWLSPLPSRTPACPSRPLPPLACSLRG
jgi:hypothetical protein